MSSRRLFAYGGLGAGVLGGVGVFVDEGGPDRYTTLLDPFTTLTDDRSGGWGSGGVGVFVDRGGATDTYSFAGLDPAQNNGQWATGVGGVGSDG